MLIVVIAALALGTYATRLGGVLLRERLDLPEWALRLLPVGRRDPAGRPRGDRGADRGRPVRRPGPPGRSAGRLLLAWRRAPFVLVVLAAAGTTAGLRLLGVQ